MELENEAIAATYHGMIKFKESTRSHCEENYFERSLREMEIKGSDRSNP